MKRLPAVKWNRQHSKINFSPGVMQAILSGLRKFILFWICLQCRHMRKGGYFQIILLLTQERDLPDICLHPDYEKNGWIYFSYSAPESGSPKKIGNTAIMRARLRNNQLTDQQVIFKATPATDRGQHFDFPQKLDSHNGKIHRINDDGTIPADNPFVAVSGAMPAIYSYPGWKNNMPVG
jgi:glucose/arabinose dehydrogenase